MYTPMPPSCEILQPSCRRSWRRYMWGTERMPDGCLWENLGLGQSAKNSGLNKKGWSPRIYPPQPPQMNGRWIQGSLSHIRENPSCSFSFMCATNNTRVIKIQKDLYCAHLSYYHFLLLHWKIKGSPLTRRVYANLKIKCFKNFHHQKQKRMLQGTTFYLICK